MNCSCCGKWIDQPETGAIERCHECECGFIAYSIPRISLEDIMDRQLKLESKLDELLKERNERLDASRH